MQVIKKKLNTNYRGYSIRNYQTKRYQVIMQVIMK
jgi:hypothetical protein